MQNQVELEKRIRTVLNESVKSIEVNTDDVQYIISRFDKKMQEEGKTMNVIKFLAGREKFKTYKPLIICSLSVIILVSSIFVQPVKTWAQDGINNALKLVYTVVKGDDGKYEAVKVAVDENSIKSSTQKEVNKNEVKFAYKAPNELKNGYKLVSTHAIVPETTGTETKDTAPDRMENWYADIESKTMLCLTISRQDDFMQLAKNKDGHENTKNRQEMQISQLPVYYYENAIPEYPLVKDPLSGKWTNDLTQKPIRIYTNHCFVWENEGVYYQLKDLGRMTSATVKSYVESIIQYQLEE